eukprot:5373301-Alexandrium_andersonii.AAC.1
MTLALLGSVGSIRYPVRSVFGVRVVEYLPDCGCRCRSSCRPCRRSCRTIGCALGREVLGSVGSVPLVLGSVDRFGSIDILQ